MPHQRFAVSLAAGSAIPPMAAIPRSPAVHRRRCAGPSGSSPSPPAVSPPMAMRSSASMCCAGRRPMPPVTRLTSDSGAAGASQQHQHAEQRHLPAAPGGHRAAGRRHRRHRRRQRELGGGCDGEARRIGRGDHPGWAAGTVTSASAFAAITAGTAFAPGTNDPAAAAWRLTLDADTTNGCITVNGTGEANKTINWVARVMSVEVVG